MPQSQIRSSIRLFISLLSLCLLPAFASADGSAGHPLKWRPWSEHVFQEAQRDNKLILLSMEAVWCHWCHVMDEKTYRNEAVLKLIEERYIPVRIDQDANPAMSQRYENWGWPATIILDGVGNERQKMRGYIGADVFIAALQGALHGNDRFTPEPILAHPPQGPLTEAQRTRLEARFHAAWDGQQGGWGNGHKYLQAEPLDLALHLARHGDKQSAVRARRLLDKAMALIDPVWGGIYQYSEPGTWKRPHFEKIMSLQTQSIRIYANAYALWKDPRYLKAANRIATYVQTWLSDSAGGFYVSQDADLRGRMNGKAYYALDERQRRAAGIPIIDTNVYSRETGWAISALTALHDVAGDKALLERGKKAAAWAQAERLRPDHLFAHGTKDRDQIFLADTLAMTQALVDLYRSSSERVYLDQAAQSARAMIANFQQKDGDFIAAPAQPGAVGVLAEPVRHLDENVQAARLLNQLWHLTGDTTFEISAKKSVAWAAATPSANRGAFWPWLLLADREIATSPVHITVVGRHNDEVAAKLFAAALAYPAGYKRAEWWDPTKGPLPNPDIEYPKLEQAALFGCTEGICSLPTFKPEQVKSSLDKLFLETR